MLVLQSDITCDTACLSAHLSLSSARSQHVPSTFPPAAHRTGLRMRFRHTVPMLLALASSLAAQEHAPKANWSLADKFSSTNLRSKIFTTAVTPRWLGQSDSLCYNWKDHTG